MEKLRVGGIRLESLKPGPSLTNPKCGPSGTFQPWLGLSQEIKVENGREVRGQGQISNSPHPTLKALSPVFPSLTCSNV